MLNKVRTLKGYKLNDRDGEIGSVRDFYFDGHFRAIRYLVANIGNWLNGRYVLISPYALFAATTKVEMNRSKLFFAALLLIGATLSSCSTRLTGSWAIQKYETTSSDQQGASLNDIGFMVFDSDGTGQKNISYTIFGTQINDTSPFSWAATDKYVTIESERSAFSKTWIIIENQGKFQKWESTDGSNQVQTLELKKQ